MIRKSKYHLDSEDGSKRISRARSEGGWVYSAWVKCASQNPYTKKGWKLLGCVRTKDEALDLLNRK